MTQEQINLLLQRIQTGDEDALIELHSHYVNLVFSVAFQVLHHQEDSEEVTQDVFMRIWNRAEQYDPERGKFTSWLLSITRRMAIDRIRQRRRKNQVPQTISLDESPYVWEQSLVYDDLTDLQRSLVSTLAELPADQRHAIQLSYFRGMTHTEIAEHLDKPLGTIKSHIRLGMQRLKLIWAGDESSTTKKD